MSDTTTTTKPAFDPARHLTKVKGADYLEVKHRIQWFRDVWPAGKIDTAVVSLDGTSAVFRAEAIALAADGTINGSATGHGTCTSGEFANFVEKAETKAIGRALAALGFGTQFADDFADGDGPIADAPARRAPQPTQMRPDAGNGPRLASDKQANMIYGKAKALGWDNARLFDAIGMHFDAPGDVTPEELTTRDASTIIDLLEEQIQTQKRQGGGR